jgi:membrane associated rhomboid family serine protease
MTESPQDKPPLVWSGYLLALVLIVWQIKVAGFYGVTDNVTLIEFGARKPNAGFPQAPWRLVASMFLHGGWLHVLANAFLLAVWGSQWTRLVGALGMVATFLVTGIWGNLLSDVYGPEALAVGASGGTSGLVLAVLCLSVLGPERSGWYGEHRQWLRVSAAVVVLNVAMAFGLTSVAGGRLDHWAHAGGAAAGAALGCFASRGEGTRWFWLSAACLAVAAAGVVWYRGPSPFG